MKKISLLACISLLIGSGVVQADSGDWYVGAKVGIVSQKDETGKVVVDKFNDGDFNVGFESGNSFGGVVGHNLGMFRVEGEYSHVSSDVDSLERRGFQGKSVQGTLNANKFMFNVYQDFPVTNEVGTYIGAGLGMTRSTFKDVSYHDTRDVERALESNDDLSFTGQFMTGISAGVAEGVNMTAGYKYTMSEAFEFTDAFGETFELPTSNHALEFGLNYHAF